MQLLKPWDVAAGTLILQEAGGVITNPKGKLNKQININKLYNIKESNKCSLIIEILFHNENHNPNQSLNQKRNKTLKVKFIGRFHNTIKFLFSTGQPFNIMQSQLGFLATSNHQLQEKTIKLIIDTDLKTQRQRLKRT